LLMTEPVYAEWIEAASATNGLKAYVNLDTLRRNGDSVEMWNLYDYENKETERQNLSSEVQQEFDCREERYRILAFTDFAENMGNGRVLFSASRSSDWMPVEPDTIVESIWNIACTTE